MKQKLSLIALFFMLFYAGTSTAQNALKPGNKLIPGVHNTKSTGHVLYFCDLSQGTDYMLSALTASGYGFESTLDYNYFADNINSGSYDLGILLCQGESSTNFQRAVDSLSSFVNKGGNAIYSDWDKNAINGALFGLDYTGNQNLGVCTVTSPFLSINLPENPITIANPTKWGTFSVGLKAINNSDTLAIFENGDAAIILGVNESALTLGFTNDAVSDNTLFVNALNFMIKKQKIGDRKFYFMNRDDYNLRRCNPDGSDVEIVSQIGVSGSGQYGMVIDKTNDKIYWTDWSSSTVMRCDMNGANPEVIVKDVISTPLGIAIDETAGKLYITDQFNHKIVRCNLDGSTLEEIITETDQITAVTVDIENSKLYFASLSSLKRANLDGTGIEILSTTNIAFVAQIFVDSYHEKLYWANEGGSSFVSSEIDGTNQTVVYTSGDYPEGVWYSRTDNRLYGIDWNGTDGFFSMNTDGTDLTVLFNENSSMVGLFAIEPEILLWKITFNVSDNNGQIEGATVVIDTNTDLTDATGKAILFDYAAGTYHYTVFKSGHNMSEGDVVITDHNMLVDVNLNFTNINDLANAKFTVSPNPSKGIFTLKTEQKSGQISVRDLTGRIICEKQIEAQSTSFDLSNQAKGVYFIDMKTDNSVKTQKIVIE